MKKQMTGRAGERQKDSIKVLVRTARWGKTGLSGQVWQPPPVHASGTHTQSRPRWEWNQLRGDFNEC